LALLEDIREPESRKIRCNSAITVSETSNQMPVLRGHAKTGQRWSGQNQPTELAGDSVVFNLLPPGEASLILCANSAGRIQSVAMMEEAIEPGGCVRAVAQEFSPVPYGSIRSEQSTGALIPSHHDFQQRPRRR
jgi:hypothetical protein